MSTARARSTSHHNGDDSDPDWSPDGTKIAFSSNRDDSSHPAIYVMNADGSGVTRLTIDDPSAIDIQPAWSPDGGWLAFSRLACGSSLFNCSRDIWVMSANGAVPSWFAGTGGYDEYFEPVWSPDGQMIAYEAGSPGGAYPYIQVDRGDIYRYPDTWQWVLAIGFDPSWRR